MNLRNDAAESAVCGRIGQRQLAPRSSRKSPDRPPRSRAKMPRSRCQPMRSSEPQHNPRGPRPDDAQRKQICAQRRQPAMRQQQRLKYQRDQRQRGHRRRPKQIRADRRAGGCEELPVSEGIRSALSVNRKAAEAASNTRFSRFFSSSFEIARTLMIAAGSEATPQAMQCEIGRNPSEICMR